MEIGVSKPPDYCMVAVMDGPRTGAVTRISMLPRGAVLAGVAVALVVGGLLRVDGPLATLGVTLAACLALAGGIAWLNGSALRISVLGPAKVEAGRAFPVGLSITNPSRFADAGGLRIELWADAALVAEASLPWLAAGSSAEIDLRVVVARRGQLAAWTVKVHSELPFGCFGTVRHHQADAAIVVLPKPVVPAGLQHLSGPLELHHAAPAWTSMGPGDTRGLRGWQPGDPPKRIHWPATLRSLARGAGWVVVETEPPGFRPERFVLLIHSVGGSRGLIRPERFERALSFAAGLLRLLHSQAVPARMLADFDQWQPRPATRRGELAFCLETLASAKRATGTEIHELQAALATVRDDEGLIVLSDMPTAAWIGLLRPRMQRAFTPESEPLRKQRKGVRA